MVQMNEAAKYELESLIELLEGIRGRHTELITVYVPSGFTLTQVTKQLEDEKGTATNIKSNTTRKNVINALEKAIRKLKEIGKTPTNGLALFSGNISEVEGKEDLQVWAIEPPKKLKVRVYRCDQTFVLEPLREMLVTDEVYGLLIIERNEASIGILDGKHIKLLQNMTSGIPGKTRAGGQCLSPDTLVMKDNGEIIAIDKTHNPLIVVSENLNKEISEETPIIAKWENEKELFEITTCYPKFKIKASKDHTFFVRTNKGIEEKPLSEIKEGDYLIMPEKINLSLQNQEIPFSPKIKQSFNLKNVNIPNIMNQDLARILGYYLGDGSYEVDRITFFEQRKEVAEYYVNLIKKVFEINPDLRFRDSKNYWQLRVYSRIISQFFRSFFSLENKTLTEQIPSLILMSSDDVLKAFIGGFFDAEGYISKGRVAFGINNSFLSRQIQFALLRLGIISSINEYDNKRNPYSNKTRYTLSIDCLESLKKFRQLICFCSNEKQLKVNHLIKSRSNRNKVRSLVANGSEVAKIIRSAGLDTHQFHCPLFFVNKRQMSKEIFKKRILDKITNKELKKRLEFFYNSNLISIKIDKIKPIGIKSTIDIETKNHNFVANGILVHNSSQRFHRIRESMTKEFFKRVAEAMKQHFFENKKLKGILVGGPIPTKEEFLEHGQLTTELKKKVIAVKDLGGTGYPGLVELVNLCQDTLAEQEITKQKKIMDEFFEKLAKEPDKVSYGEAEVIDRLNRGAVEKLILSKTLERKKIKEFETLANSTSSEIHLVSNETAEGIQFDNLGGVGAILRFMVVD